MREYVVRTVIILFILLGSENIYGSQKGEEPGESKGFLARKVQDLKDSTWILIVGVHTKTSFLGKGSFGPYVGIARKSSRDSAMALGVNTKVSLGRDGYSLSLLPTVLVEFWESETLHPHFTFSLGPSLVHYHVFGVGTKLTFKAIMGLGMDIDLSKSSAIRIQSRLLYWDRTSVGTYSLFMFAPQIAVGFIL